MVLCHELGRMDFLNKQIRHRIVCASYLFVFMSNSLGKTNTVTTQRNDLLKQVCPHVMYMLQHHNKKTSDLLLTSLISSFESLKNAVKQQLQNAQVRPRSLLLSANAKLVNNK